MYKAMVFYCLQENLEVDMVKKLVNTEISFAKKISNSKYGKKTIDTTKKEGVNFGKIAGKKC